MSTESQEPNSNAEAEETADSDGEPDVEDTTSAPALTLALPDGSESVSDAIVTNREMLREPQEHGLATDQDITHLSKAMEGLSSSVEEVKHEHEKSESEIDELRETVERQRQQIDELQSMVTSLADILGTEAEWDTFEDE